MEFNNNFTVETNEQGKIIDFLDSKILEPNPEEFVRQHFLKILHFEYKYPKELIAREIPIYSGSKEAIDSNGHPARADIVVYNSSLAKKQKDQGKIRLIVECKSPNEKKGYNQLVSYIYNTSSEGGVWYNGEKIYYHKRLFEPHNQLVEWTGIPSKDEAWDSLGRRNKDELIRPKDIKSLLRQCHNKLHGRGVDSDEEDLTLDMVRIILSKAIDEEKAGDKCDFYCTPEEICRAEGREIAAKRVKRLFDQVKKENPSVFSPNEKISVGSRTICDVIIELQRYRLLSDLNESDDWDLMGHAYEEYTATYLKRKKGQYFTNRFIIDLIINIIDPEYNDIILDPAGGSGGFLTGTMRYIRRKTIRNSNNKISRQRQLDKHRNNLFMVEMSRRLVKIAKTAMILNGDGHAGITQGDSLGEIENLHERVCSICNVEKPSVILTNPPFAGTNQGLITNKQILSKYLVGHKWSSQGGNLIKTNTLSDGIPPEMLFLEKCIQWISPGGKVGIVLPKSFLDTQTYLPARKILLEKCNLLAIIICHKNTFQPYTGVRTCIVIFQKKNNDDLAQKQKSIFMAISRKIGQDSEGKPIYKRDDDNKENEIIDHDLLEILEDFKSHTLDNLKSSEYRFKIKTSDLDEKINLNPQFHLPNLNKVIKRLEKIDEYPGWSISTLSQISSDIKIFKGPRIKTENLIVESPNEFSEPYYTPSAVLQEKSDSLKLLDISRATKKQLKAIDEVRVKKNDIVVTRSGSIGRIAWITSRLDNAIVSDDLIRVRIHNETLRYYVYLFLISDIGYAQMIKNEYGAVQQHLEPNHLQNILIPLPNDFQTIKELTNSSRNYIESKEKLEQNLKNLKQETSNFIKNLMSD